MKAIIVTLLLVSRLAYADLDDTIEESVLKYGPASATASPQILTYTTDRFRIWQTFDDSGHCAIAEFAPLDPAAPFTAHELAEMDCNNLPDAMIPGIGSRWEKVPWHDKPRTRNTISFQYTEPDDGTHFQVISGESRDDDNGDWYDDRIYLNNTGIQMFKSGGKPASSPATSASTPATSAGGEGGDAAPKAAPVYKTYTRRDGKKVLLSASQSAIANKDWHAVAPENIAETAASITVVIRVQKRDGTHILGTGFFISPSEVLTDWHVVRDAENITIVTADDVRANAQLESSQPSVDLATIMVPSVYCKSHAHFVSDSDWERQGETVYVYGNPQGMDGTFSEGMLSAIRRNGAVFQLSAPTDSGSSGSPVFNCYGLVIAIVGDRLAGSAQLNFAVTSNAIYEALGLKTDDHPDGFDLGLTQGLELRNQSEIDADLATENAARIEAENKAKAAAGPSAEERASAPSSSQP